MGWRIVGGLVGWIVGLAPLALVNALALAIALDPSSVPLAGGAALLVGIALGGAAAGLLGGRRSGAWSGVLSGAIAAALYVATLLALGDRLRTQHDLPYLLALHPVRAIVAVGFLGCLLLCVAAALGLLLARRRASASRVAVSAAPTFPPAYPYPRASGPSRPPRDARDTRAGSHVSQPSRTAPSRARERSPRW